MLRAVLLEGRGAIQIVFALLLLLIPANALAEATIATYNINYGNVNLPRIIASIEASDADVVCLQEVTEAAKQHLEETLRERYPHMAFYPARWASGFGFLSRIPLADVEYREPTSGLFGVYLATIQLGGHPLRLINVHLSPNLPKRGESAFAFMQRALNQEGTRIEELEQWLAAAPASPEYTRIIIGDFNSMRGMGLLGHLEKHGFIDAFSRVVPDAESHPTWSWGVGGHAIRLRIDHVFVEAEGLEPETARVIVDELPSDHFLVWVRFR